MQRVRSKKYAGVYFQVLANKDKSYYITYKQNGKKVWKKIGLHSEGVREAYCFKQRAKILNLIRLGEAPENKVGVLFDDVAREYFDAQTYSDKSKRDFYGRYVKHIKPVFGDKSLKQISEKDIVDFQKAKRKELANQSVNHLIMIIKSIFKYAIKEKIISYNPCEDVSLLRVDNKRERFLSKDEIERLLESVQYDFDVYMFCLISLTTGARRAGVLNIRYKDINFSNNTITIKDFKTESTYTAFLHDKVKEFLSDDGKKPNDYVINISDRTLSRRLKEHLDKLFNKGLDKRDSKNRVVIHTLRHTFASQLAIKGTPIFTIQKLLNHKDITHTLRYAKLSPDSGRDMVDGLI